MQDRHQHRNRLPPKKLHPCQHHHLSRPLRHVVVVEPIRVYDPFFDYPYPYAYPPDYMAANFGYVKIKTDYKGGSIYIDGGFADKLDKTKKFALRSGTHDIELHDLDGASG